VLQQSAVAREMAKYSNCSTSTRSIQLQQRQIRLMRQLMN